VTLPAFAAKRRRLSIDISRLFPRGAQQQTRRTPLLLSIVGQMDGPTDGRSTVS